MDKQTTVLFNQIYFFPNNGVGIEKLIPKILYAIFHISHFSVCAENMLKKHICEY